MWICRPHHERRDRERVHYLLSLRWWSRIVGVEFFFPQHHSHHGPSKSPLRDHAPTMMGLPLDSDERWTHSRYDCENLPPLKRTIFLEFRIPLVFQPSRRNSFESLSYLQTMNPIIELPGYFMRCLTILVINYGPLMVELYYLMSQCCTVMFRLFFSFFFSFFFGFTRVIFLSLYQSMPGEDPIIN